MTPLLLLFLLTGSADRSMTGGGRASFPAAAAESWALVLATEGGFQGRGVGGVEVRSSGEAWITPFVGQRCDFKLSDEERARVEAAVRASSPKAWKPRYVRADNPGGCCDQVTTLVFLQLKKGKAETHHATGWFDDSRKLAPIDAQRLAATATVLKRAHPCKPKR